MYGQEKFEKILKKYPHSGQRFFERPHLSRRHFVQLAGSGLIASFLPSRLPAGPITTTYADVTMQNKAKNVIFVLLAGAPSHTDTFDLKMVNGTTPAMFNPATINNMLWPTGIMPKLGAQLNDIAIIRSVRASALVHGLGQNWVQIGRNPAAVLGNISPNIGSVVAIEKEPERSANQVFPTFLALNSPGGVGEGYFSAEYAPFRVAPNSAGLTNTSNADGETRFDTRYDFLHHMDDSLRVNSPLGQPVSDYNNFYMAAKGVMYNPVVTKAFSFSGTDHLRYGNTSFGDACLVAKQVLAANQGTRFIQITLGGWDMHQNIYATANLGAGTNSPIKTLDDGLSALLTDLKADGSFADTMVVMMGEFGRTVGKITAALGRDHYPQQFALFAGAGVKGGAIGSTTADGSATNDPGWSRQRNVQAEDIEATIYSAMGINWTTVRHDDPLGRGFYYVPNSDQDLYGPVNELWGPTT